MARAVGASGTQLTTRQDKLRMSYRQHAKDISERRALVLPSPNFQRAAE
jgi:hypothetical protein